MQSKDYAKRGPGFWKFNNSFLKDDNFVKNHAENIPEFKDKHAYLTDKGLYWDMLKMEIRGFYVQYSKRKNRDKRSEERDLQKQIDTLMIALQTNRTKDNITKLHTLRARLNQIAEYRTMEAMVRSRVRWHEEGERNTKYFLNLENINFSSTHISRLKSREGNKTTNAEAILSMQKRCYEQLYAQVPCTNEDGDAFFNNPDLFRLSENDQRILEQPLTEKECLEVLKQCGKNKSPGSDGLSVEFYLQFWNLVGDEMVQSFNYAQEEGRLNITQRQGIIKVLPKKKKDRIYLENWRPVPLLDVDYKLNVATKLIAHRIAKILPKLINEDQTGYVKGRYIGQNIRVIKDVMKLTDLEQISGITIFIDCKKALDTVDWRFLHKTLEMFNFGPQIQQWVKTFYSDATSCVINNGYASEFFKLQRGVRQGCLLSGPLFVLCAEILANSIRADKTINGLNIYNREIKPSHYADDTTVLVADLSSAQNLFSL